MNKRKDLKRNLFILLMLFLFLGSFSNTSLTPLAAHKKSERTANYGPSTIAKVQRIKGGMLYLCKYDKWYSLSAVVKDFFWLWHPGDQVLGTENNLKNPINYNLGYSTRTSNHTVGQFYGIVNDSNIKSVKLELNLSGQMKIFEQEELYDNMFLFIWENNIQMKYMSAKIIGYDKDSNIIYKGTYPEAK